MRIAYVYMNYITLNFTVTLHRCFSNIGVNLSEFLCANIRTKHVIFDDHEHKHVRARNTTSTVRIQNATKRCTLKAYMDFKPRF